MVHLYCRVFFYKSFFFPEKMWMTLKHLFATTFGFSDLQNISYWRFSIEREKPLFGQLCAKMNPAVICDGIYGFAGRGGGGDQTLSIKHEGSLDRSLNIQSFIFGYPRVKMGERRKIKTHHLGFFILPVRTRSYKKIFSAKIYATFKFELPDRPKLVTWLESKCLNE